MPVWWTKRSLPPSSGVTKPKPLSSLNHFTVPVAMIFLHGLCALRTRRKLQRQRLRALNTLSSSAARRPEHHPAYRKNLRPPTTPPAPGRARPAALENNVCCALSLHVVGAARARRSPPAADSPYAIARLRPTVALVLPNPQHASGRAGPGRF